jgi:hypothetical protein
LQQAADPGSSDWMPVTNGAVLDLLNLQVHVTAPWSSSNAFYRLKGE